MIEKYNNNVDIPLQLTSFCEVPPGSGLGIFLNFGGYNIKSIYRIF